MLGRATKVLCYQEATKAIIKGDSPRPDGVAFIAAVSVSDAGYTWGGGRKVGFLCLLVGIG